VNVAADYAGISAPRLINKARAAVARHELSMLAAAVEGEHRFTGNLPRDAEELRELVVAVWGEQDGAGIDPWGNPYEIVELSDGEAMVRSLGPDGAPGDGCARVLSADQLTDGGEASSDDVCAPLSLDQSPGIYRAI
jgi:hypothetical protein